MINTHVSSDFVFVGLPLVGRPWLGGERRPYRPKRHGLGYDTFRRLCVLLTLNTAAALAGATDPNRLDQLVMPLAQAVELTLDPATEGYRGRVRIDLRVHEPVTGFRLHAKGLKLGSAELLQPGKRTPVRITVSDGEIGLIAVEPPAPILAGLHTLEIAFEGDFKRTGAAIYKTVYRDEPYVYTQMQDVHGRRAFPCWDDPEFKIPWQLTLTIPRQLAVAANTPAVYSETSGEQTTWRFGRTRPMPSYLLAFAVGPLEFVPVPGLPIPGRIVTPHGQAALAGHIADISPGLLGSLERYFGVPYPYEKLDQFAVPEFVFSGMENAGAIMYRDAATLFPAGKLSHSQHKSLAELVAHEMAHMWFGDLVTMRWWTDLWLNESFATWISHKVVGEVLPELGAEVERVRSVHEAMTLDSQAVVEPIRREMLAGGDTTSLVDTLTYNKGQAVLDMTEAWLGEAVFRQAMQAYFQRYAWGSTDAADLWRTLDETSGKNVSEIVTPFVTQPGIPFLEFEIAARDRLKVSQSRFHTLTGAASAERWSIPVFLRYASGGRVQQHRFLLSETTKEVTVPGITAAEWIWLNDGARGYYRWSLPAARLGRLTRVAAAQLSSSERLNLIDNAAALFAAGKIDGATSLEAIAAFVSDADADVAEKAVEELTATLRIFSHAGNRTAVAAALRRVFNPLVARIGWTPRGEEPAAVGPLRKRLLVLLGEAGEDPGAIAAARDLARTILAGEKVNPELRAAALRVSVAHGDRALMDALLLRLATDLTPAERRETLQALGGCREPALVDLALAFALSDRVNSSEILQVPFELVRAEENRPLVVEWMIRNYETLAKRVPDLYFGSLMRAADGNDALLLKRLRDFLLDPVRAKPAAAKQAGLVTERVALRTELRAREQASVDAALAALGGPRTDTAPAPVGGR